MPDALSFGFDPRVREHLERLTHRASLRTHREWSRMDPQLGEAGEPLRTDLGQELV
jgi:hypothetical protein